jgi:sulfur carrier protein ThiS
VFLHTKTNIDQSGSMQMHYLINDILGSRDILQKALTVLLQEKNGMVGSGRYLAEGFYTYEESRKAHDIIKRLGLTVNRVVFIAGTMFIVKAEILDKYLRNDGVIEIFCNDFYEDGTKNSGWHHAWERVFGMLVSIAGKQVISFIP